jgi:membrane-associated phospholipid phosphatase
MPLQVGNILLVTGVAWTRVEAGVHYPSDVLASAAIGHFLSTFIDDAFMGIPEHESLGFCVLPSRHGTMIGVCFGF